MDCADENPLIAPPCDYGWELPDDPVAPPPVAVLAVPAPVEAITPSPGDDEPPALPAPAMPEIYELDDSDLEVPEVWDD